MTLKTDLKIFGYGFLLFIITMILLFLMSVVTGSDQPIDYWWVGVVVAIIMAIISLWFSRLMRPATTKQAFIYGVIWAVMLAIILLIIAIPNNTTSIVFGQWSTYLVFVGIAIGPVLMKPKYYIPIIIIALLVIVGIYFYSQQSITTIENQRTYPTTSSFDFYQINEIKQNNFTSGNFNTEGYVVKIYTCPPCPKGAFCKLCMRDNIVVSKNNKQLDAYYLTENELIVFANNPKQFELGKKYKFSVKILDYKSTGEPLNDVELVGFELIE